MDLALEIKGLKVKVLDGPYIENGQITSEGSEFAEMIISNFEQYRIKATEKLLPLYLDSWFDDDIGELSEDEFIDNLKSPEVILYDEKGAACIFFDDSEMFAGHLIEVFITDYKVNSVDIVG